jgi:hypothetical protein
MQSNGKTSLTRIELEYKGTSYEFSINPQELLVSYKNRVGVTQTLGGHWVDKYGTGLPEITFSGVTGYKIGKDADEGYNKYKELKTLIQTIFSSEDNLRTNQDVTPMRFYNFTDEDYWDVIPTDFSVQRSISNPLIFRYSFKAYGVNNMNEPNNTVIPTNTGGILDNTLGSDIANSHKQLYENIKEKYTEIKSQKDKFADFIKEKIPFSSEIGKVVKNLGVQVDLQERKVSVSGSLEQLGVRLPFSVNTKGETLLGVDIENTGTILDGLSMLTGTNGNGEISPIMYSYSSGGINLSGIQKKQQKFDNDTQKYLSKEEEINFNLKPEILTKISENFNKGDYENFDYDSYIIGEKNSQNFSSILAKNYKRYDSILQYSSMNSEGYLLEEEKKQLTYILVNSIIITHNSITGLLGGEFTITENIVNSQITIIEDFLSTLRDKKDARHSELIQALEQLKLSYRSLNKMKFFGGEL